MTDWITDRPPTEADGDCEGYVRACVHPGSGVSGFVHWSYVKIGVPWRRTVFWRPAAPAPEPAPEPATEPPAAPELSLADFKVGQWWRRRDGRLAIIEEIDSDDSTVRAGGWWYYANGRFCGGIDASALLDRDLIELIHETPDPVPEPASDPAPGLPEGIRTGVAPFYVLVVSDDAGGCADDGKAIAWETAIPNGSSLQAVLQRRANVGNRYGPTFVAECRILSDQEIATRAEPAAEPPAEPEPTPQTRKVPRGFLAFFDLPRNTQGGTGRTVVAIATDQTAWYRVPNLDGGRWAQVPPLPDREEPLDA